MAEKGRDALFGWIARVGVARPLVVLAVIAVVMLGFGSVAPRLSVSTSRTSLIADDDPQQQRTNAFYEAFGRPDAPLFVVSGGTAAQRRTAVDALVANLETDESFAGMAMGRIAPADVAGTLLLQKPEALGEVAAALGPEANLPLLAASGLPGWIGAVAEQIEAGLDGQEQPTDPAAAPPDVAEGLARLAVMAGVLDDVIVGRDPTTRLAPEREIAGEGFDEAGYLITTDGNHNLVPIYTTFESDEGTVLEPIVTRLRELRDEALANGPADVTAVLTGTPALSVDELAIVRGGLVSSSAAATVGIFGLCLLLFRSLRQTVVALLPLLPGIVVTLGAVYFIYGHLNLITSSFVAVLLGLGIDFSVHVIARRNEEVRRGLSEVDAVKTAIRRTGPGIATGAVITAAAFLTNATTEFTAYGQLGIITAIGLMAILAATLFLIPPLMVVGRSGAKATRPAPEPPGIGTVVKLVRRFKGPLTLAGLALGVAGALALPRIEFNSRYFDFLPVTTESAQGLGALEYDNLASPVFAVMRAPSIADARARAEQLRALDSVAGVQTPSDLLPELNKSRLAALRGAVGQFAAQPIDIEGLAGTPVDQAAVTKAVGKVVDALDEVRFALEGAGQPTAPAEDALKQFKALQTTLRGLDDAGKERLAGIHRGVAEILGPALETAARVAERGAYSPQDVPPRFATRFVSQDGAEVALFAVPSGSFWEVEVADKFAADVRAVDPDACGLAMVHVEHGQMVLAGFRRAAMYAAGIILLLLLLDFRSLTDALLALLPTALGWLWMLALMPVLGLDFNVANIVALPLVIGIGIAFGVHMMHRLREPAETTASSRGEGLPDLDAIVRGTGGAIGVAASTTMVGFAGLVISEYGGMKSLGLTMVLGIGTCLVATVLVLPAVLLLLKRVE